MEITGNLFRYVRGGAHGAQHVKLNAEVRVQKKSKALLRMNPEKYAHFVNATSIAVKLQWDNKHQANRIKNMGAAVKVAASKMSQKERSVKFGWMNNEKVTPERKRQVWELSLKAWFDGLSEEQKREFHSNRADKIMKSEKQYLRRMYDNNQSSNAKCNAWTLNLYKCDFFKLDFNKIFGTE